MRICNGCGTKTCDKWLRDMEFRGEPEFRNEWLCTPCYHHQYKTMIHGKHAGRICVTCGSKNTTYWRKSKDKDGYNCCKCYFAIRNRDPEYLEKRRIYERERYHRKKLNVEINTERYCGDCGCTNGEFVGTWGRTNGVWYCNPCRCRLYKIKKKL